MNFVYVVIILCGIYYKEVLCNNSSQEVVNLPNEECKPRKTLVAVDGDTYNYFPLMVSLHRCGGICGRDKPNFRKCVKKESDILFLHVYNELEQRNETIKLENHTSCGCECYYDKSVCSSTQTWDTQQCKCLCNPSVTGQCGENYRWNPNLCQCQCDLQCTRKQDFNSTDCSCTCKQKFFQRCNKRNKLVRESDCRCFIPETLLSEKGCEVLPTKWAVMIITISFCAFFVFAFDCILYGRKTGCLYHSLHICEDTKEENIPIKQNRSPSSKDIFDSNA
ncbi:vascular endothelial growth factor D-like [Hydractinia symbiolongicarpus]|uniref:vascular endothelial growth factor D-like n=1 Tax=Hydractinia symbiolongicarpus TaxID=13093 RepID=UPI00254FBEC6|nr:vascular endothelial growth factor D-like [Hydractinia symbiolongicarpus]